VGLSFITSRDPNAYILSLKQQAKPTTAMLELVVEQFKTDMLEKTARGVDFEERPFAPYSTKGPYYYYPNGRIGAKGQSLKLAQGAAKRLQKKINAGEVTAGGGIKFASYAEFKKALGRTNVDLTGPRAPHMLQAIVRTTRGGLEVSLGIYGAEAARASGHNNGGKNLPQRKFFAVSAKDKENMRLRLLKLVKENGL
jgi:hypothetical protein